MPTPKNAAIGKVECPVKQCAEACEVFRYRERGDSDKSVANRRFAGKLYGRCPKHGRFGGDAGDDAMQDYILRNAQMSAPVPTSSPGRVRPIKPQSQNVRPAPLRHPIVKPRRASVTVDTEGEDASDDAAAFGFFR